MRVLDWQGRELPKHFCRECEENEFTIGEEVVIHDRHFRVIGKEHVYNSMEYVQNARPYWNWEAEFIEI